MVTRLIVVALLAGSCGRADRARPREDARGSPVAANASPDAGQVADAASAPAVVVPTTPWTYSRNDDRMRGTTNHLAWVNSSNTCSVAFPESGEARLQMAVRRMDKEDAVVIRVAAGAVGDVDICVPTCNVAAKFDDGKVQTFEARGLPNVGSKTLIYITKYKSWIRALKDSKSAIVEVNMFSSGRCQFDFATAGLAWPP